MENLIILSPVGCDKEGFIESCKTTLPMYGPSVGGAVRSKYGEYELIDSDVLIGEELGWPLYASICATTGVNDYRKVFGVGTGRGWLTRLRKRGEVTIPPKWAGKTDYYKIGFSNPPKNVCRVAPNPPKEKGVEFVEANCFIFYDVGEEWDKNDRLCLVHCSDMVGNGREVVRGDGIGWVYKKQVMMVQKSELPTSSSGWWQLETTAPTYVVEGVDEFLNNCWSLLCSYLSDKSGYAILTSLPWPSVTDFNFGNGVEIRTMMLGVDENVGNVTENAKQRRGHQSVSEEVDVLANREVVSGLTTANGWNLVNSCVPYATWEAAILGTV